MTSADIKQQIADTDAKKVEVFVCGQYAPDHRIETVSMTSMGAAMKAALQK